MLRWFVSKVVQYVVDELYASEKFRKMISEAIIVGVPRDVVRRESVAADMPVVSTDLKSIAQAFGKIASERPAASLSKDLTAGGKVVRSDSAKSTIDLLKGIGE
jgi:hypothetical protein